MTLEASLPSLYLPWLRTILGGPIPAETKATCDNCVMLRSPESPPDAAYFHSATKCCAYQPWIANFLAGRILSDSDPAMAEGRKELEQHIARRVAITPRQAGPGGVFPLLYENTPNAFGRAPSLRCQFLTSAGGCGIWKHRPGVCATWFCKHVRGNTSFRFWKLADKLLSEAERDLTFWCLAELRAGSLEIEEQGLKLKPDVSELEGEIDWRRYRKLWGEWAGRESDFYRACGRLVEPLDWAEVERKCGPRVSILAGLLRDSYSHLTSQAIPERLRVSDFRFIGMERGGFRVCAYSNYDPLVMPEALVRTLRYFDGRPTYEALEAILAKQRTTLEPSLVRRMVDFGILEPYEPDPGPLHVLG